MPADRESASGHGRRRSNRFTAFFHSFKHDDSREQGGEYVRDFEYRCGDERRTDDDLSYVFRMAAASTASGEVIKMSMLYCVFIFLGYIDNCLSFENVSMFACTFDICIKLLLTYYLWRACLE